VCYTCNNYNSNTVNSGTLHIWIYHMTQTQLFLFSFNHHCFSFWCLCFDKRRKQKYILRKANIKNSTCNKTWCKTFVNQAFSNKTPTWFIYTHTMAFWSVWQDVLLFCSVCLNFAIWIWTLQLLVNFVFGRFNSKLKMFLKRFPDFLNGQAIFLQGSIFAVIRSSLTTKKS